MIKKITSFVPKMSSISKFLLNLRAGNYSFLYVYIIHKKKLIYTIKMKHTYIKINRKGNKKKYM